MTSTRLVSHLWQFKFPLPGAWSTDVFSQVQLVCVCFETRFFDSLPCRSLTCCVAEAGLEFLFSFLNLLSMNMTMTTFLSFIIFLSFLEIESYCVFESGLELGIPKLLGNSLSFTSADTICPCL